jgi:hypothetical protein
MIVTVNEYSFFYCIQGDEIFEALLKAGLEKKVKIRIAQNLPSPSSSPSDTEILANTSAAEVYSLLLLYLL